jgi:predicted transcriptional regulator
MRNKKSVSPLGETELEVMRHVWALGEATVGEVHQRIQRDRPVAYTTILTVMKNLSEKGYLAAEREGTRDRFRPLRSEADVQETVLGGILGPVFGGSAFALVQTLVRQERLSDSEREEIRRLIDALPPSDDEPSR